MGHHRGDIDQANDPVERAGLIGATLENLVLTPKGPLFENAAQAWNHAVYWNWMAPSSDELHQGSSRRVIDRDFGEPAAPKVHLNDAALSLFGSGWTWLVQQPMCQHQDMTVESAEGRPRIGWRPLLTWTLWEHADHRRPA